MDFYGPYMVRFMVSKFGQPGQVNLANIKILEQKSIR